MPVTGDKGQPDIETWKDHAACRGWPVEWWFPPRQKGRAHVPGRGEAICATCPVQDECRAAGEREPEGIWGGVLKPIRTHRKPNRLGPRPSRRV